MSVVLRKPLLLDPEKAKTTVLACVYLHNFLRKRKTIDDVIQSTGTHFDADDPEYNIVEGTWRQPITILISETKRYETVHHLFDLLIL